MGFKKVLTASLCVLGFARVQAQSTDTITVHFDLNQSVLRPEDKVTLDHRFDRSGRRITSIELAGYCDSVGENRYNDSLAWQRVAEVKKYLQSKGIADTLFKVLHSYGKHRPLNDNGTDERRNLNRRVEIVFNSFIPPASIPYLETAFRDTGHLSGRKNIVLKKVTFYGDRHFPLPTSYPELLELRNILREHPGIRIEIQGYVCCNAPDKDGYDQDTHTPDLSVQRAKYIYQYLIKLGIDSSRMTYRGFGAAYPIFPKEENDEQRTNNRRVELKVLKQ